MIRTLECIMPADPNRVRDLFMAAAELVAAERPAYLDNACGTDAELRSAVDRLLAAHEEPASILNPAVGDSNPTEPFISDSEAHSATSVNRWQDSPGQVLAGKYSLLEPIGEGGMGYVWTARQTVPVKRTVAIKLIKPGMDSKAILARFEAERQALALMDHPNIARVLDAGTTLDGRPFFVMDLVKGVPITQFCDARRLTPRERLELFVPVCHAIQHAHQKGIIHRDIKPNNVLVALYDDRPVPKVIDFGIAKATGSALTEQTLTTAYGTVLGTPEYMSPEQATFNNLDVDTRSDVYSLGVLLYELLAGNPPITKKELVHAGVLEILRVIREVEPPRPSTKLSTADALPSLAASRGTDPGALTKLLRSELDWIVMKAIDKDRVRRYETANAFAADVQRYLSGEPVQAVPPSSAYRLRKFARKHRGAVTAVALVALAIVSGGIATGWQAIRATAAEQDAHGKAKDATNAKDEADRNAAAAAVAAAESARIAEQRRLDLYPPRIKLAWQHWSDGDRARMIEVLDTLRPAPGQSDLRGFEWRYLWGLAHRRQQTFRHPHSLRSVACAPDGKTVATVFQGSAEIWLWDAATATVRTRLDIGAQGVAVAFAPDGLSVATTDQSGAVRIWDAASGNLLHNLVGLEAPVGSVAFSSDGKRLAAATGRWTIKGGNPTERFLPAGYEKPGPISVWDTRTGNVVAKFQGHARSTLCVAFSPDGNSLASGGADGKVRVWDIANQKQRYEVADDQSAVFTLAFTPDGGTLVSGGWQMTARVRKSDDGKLVRVLSGSTGPIFTLVVNPNGREVLTAGFDRLVRRWDLATGMETGRILGHVEPVTGMSVDREWRTLYTAGWDRLMYSWPADQSQECIRLDRAPGRQVPSYHVIFSPDSRTLVATAPGEVVFYDVAKRREVKAVAVSNDRDLTAAFSPDGNILAAVGMSGRLYRWDAPGWAPRKPIQAHRFKAWGVAYSPDGKTLATGAGIFSSPGEVKLWNPTTDELLFRQDTNSNTVRTVAFTPDSSTLLYGIGNRVDRLDIASHTLLSPLPGMFHAVLSLDGKVAALGRHSDSPDRLDVEAELWDMVQGRVRAELRGHVAEIYQMAFAPDGKTLATASWDGTVKLWHVATGEELLTFRRNVGVIWTVGFSPDGNYLAIGAGTLRSRELTLWDGRTAETADRGPPAN
jgi:eukaryotic-like serine/threonine-protein kinase